MRDRRAAKGSGLDLEQIQRPFLRRPRMVRTIRVRLPADVGRGLLDAMERLGRPIAVSALTRDLLRLGVGLAPLEAFGDRTGPGRRFAGEGVFDLELDEDLARVLHAQPQVDWPRMVIAALRGWAQGQLGRRLDGALLTAEEIRAGEDLAGAALRRLAPSRPGSSRKGRSS